MNKFKELKEALPLEPLVAGVVEVGEEDMMPLWILKVLHVMMPQGHQKSKQTAVLGGILMGEVLEEMGIVKTDQSIIMEGQALWMVSFGQLGQNPVLVTRVGDSGEMQNPRMPPIVDGKDIDN